MLKKFIIDDEILFDPQKSTIINTRVQKEAVSLNVPTSRCLEALLTKKGLVTHQELYDKGWFDAAQEPLPNTLYQNILLIRQAFRKLSDKKVDFIITVPRKGFYFNDHITHLSVDVDADVDTDENDHPVQAKQGHLHEMSHVRTTETTDAAPITRHTQSFQVLVLPSWLNILLLVLAIATTLYSLKLLTAPRNEYQFKDDFIYLKNIEDCSIYLIKKTPASIDRVPNDSVIAKIIELSHQNDPILSCQDYPHRFLTIYNSPPRTIMVACKKDDSSKKDQQCNTVYLRGIL
ncbi:hypothetical protein [Enterobacter sp. MGH 16]|uniref:winged helix-turn-helix domain-containing protein n=1 Tax=Enterobacter sp. MGH 16 TaxID=1329825 RepID=UPI0003BE737D|nr:hypothetical protein [Enterobacter sp. MGH 16]ESN53162.1 hypothetical protein L362_00059 [Enterobacter sp. MGH 16]